MNYEGEYPILLLSFDAPQVLQFNYRVVHPQTVPGLSWNVSDF